MKRLHILDLILCIGSLALVLFFVIRMSINGITLNDVLVGCAMILLFIGSLIRYINGRKKENSN